MYYIFFLFKDKNYFTIRNYSSNLKLMSDFKNKKISEWRKILDPEQYIIMREEGTERPGSSELNDEKREGTYHCAGCDALLFDSKSKYESGSGWPSFFESKSEVFDVKIDNHIGYPRTEYHCSKCGSHHGHIFDDGPEPTGKRFCNNGKALKFKPKN